MMTSPSSRKPTGSSTSACVPTTRCSEPPASSACSSRRFFAGVAAGQQRQAEARGLQQPADVEEMLLRQDLGRRHEGHLEAVLHRDERRQQRDDRLAGADVALQQPVHRLRPLHVVDDLADRLLLVARQLERQHPPRRLADGVGHHDRARACDRPRARAAAARSRAGRERTPRRSAGAAPATKRVQLRDRRPFRREVHVVERGAPVDQFLAARTSGGSGSGSVGRQLRQRLVHERALHLRRSACPVFS